MLNRKRVLYLLFITFILTIGNVFGQERVIHQIDDNLYSYKYVNEEGEVTQKGFYKKVDNVFRPHEFGVILWEQKLNIKMELWYGLSQKVIKSTHIRI